jgi:hypothetical protein
MHRTSSRGQLTEGGASLRNDAQRNQSCIDFLSILGWGLYLGYLKVFLGLGAYLCVLWGFLIILCWFGWILLYKLDVSGFEMCYLSLALIQQLVFQSDVLPQFIHLQLVLLLLLLQLPP